MSRLKRLSAGLLVGTFLSTGLAAAATPKQIFVSSDKLDKHVIYQDFSFFMPYESTAYATLTKQADDLQKLGITDLWIAPPFRAIEAGFEEGYAVLDRYDLGDFAQGHNGTYPNKYGTADELRTLIGAMHDRKMHVICDLVPNQMIGLGTQEVVSVTGVDIYGNPSTSNVNNILYPAYTTGGGQGQTAHGLITQWSSQYENGTSPQYLGLDRVMIDSSGNPYRYFGPNDSRNYLPSWLASSTAVQTGQLNTTDGYLLVSGYYAIQGAGTASPIWRPYLLYYVDPHPGAFNISPLDYIRKTYNVPTATDDQIRQALIYKPDQEVVDGLNAYLSSQPGYTVASEGGFSALRFNHPDNSADIDKNVMQYEFLNGTDIDNSNPDVQAEVLHWQQYLLDSYGFDGFRFDAAGHYNTDILRQSAAMMSSRYGKKIDDHLSVIESYVDQQIAMEASNNNGQLEYDADQYNQIHGVLESPNPATALSTVFTASLGYAGRVGTGNAIPNWSFVNNHDQESNTAGAIDVPADDQAGLDRGSNQYRLDQMAIYDQDRALANKKYAPYNVPAAYALMLNNKGTVPTIYYGDMYDGDKSYASSPSVYASTIELLLQLRQTYVSGPQVFGSYTSNTSPSVAGQDLVSSARLGNRRKEGEVVIIGDNPALKTTIKVDLGSGHGSQWFVNAVGSQHELLFTNAKGVLTVPVKGESTALVHGYLGVFVPYTL